MDVSLSVIPLLEGTLENSISFIIRQGSVVFSRFAPTQWEVSALDEGGGDFFWLWRKALKSDERQMPWEYWGLSSSVAWPCLPIPSAWGIIFHPNTLRSWHHNVKQLSCLVNTIFFRRISTGICYSGSIWVSASIAKWALNAGEQPLRWRFWTHTLPTSSPFYCIDMPPVENWPRLVDSWPGSFLRRYPCHLVQDYNKTSPRIYKLQKHDRPLDRSLIQEEIMQANEHPWETAKCQL